MVVLMNHGLHFISNQGFGTGAEPEVETGFASTCAAIRHII